MVVISNIKRGAHTNKLYNVTMEKEKCLKIVHKQLFLKRRF